jgi:hypothetical protein
MPSPSKKRQVARKTRVVEKDGKKVTQMLVKEEVAMGAKILTFADLSDDQLKKLQDAGEIPEVYQVEAPVSPLVSSSVPYIPETLKGLPDMPHTPGVTVTAVQQAFAQGEPNPFLTPLSTPAHVAGSEEDDLPEIHPFNRDMVAKAKLPKKGVKWEELGAQDPAGFMEKLPLYLFEERILENNIEELTKRKKDTRTEIDTAFIVTQIKQEVVVGQYGVSRVVPTKKGTRFDFDTFINQLVAWGVDASLIASAKAASTFETEPGAPYIKIRNLVKEEKEEEGTGESA